MQNSSPEQSDIQALSDALDRLNGHRMLRVYDSTFLLMWFQFLRGLAFGLGTVVGVAALVPLVVMALNQIEFVPIVGEFATEVIKEIQKQR